MKIIRVFPRRTKASPVDRLAYFGEPDMFTRQEGAACVHVSVAFTWDIPEAERLARVWERYADSVSVGGPAYGKVGGPFVPGRYLRHGYVITSRGCPNRCWFCSVWKRESEGLHELPITWGWNILDDNLLACSEDHIRRVFAMVKNATSEVPGRRAQFTGGLEAKRLQDWHVNLLADIHPRPEVFFAYDTPDDYEPLLIAGAKMHKAGWTPESHRMRCYVLIGHPKDTLSSAENRLQAVLRAGFTPMAMLWRPKSFTAPTSEWREFQRRWARPAIIHANGEGKLKGHDNDAIASGPKPGVQTSSPAE